MGEAVPLIITLYSPGPFSGTAAFELPELPRTAIVKTGSPLVGSEEIDGESCITQRHEFTLYTQQAGEIVIPSFRVRFAGKQTFTSDPEPMEGVTTELKFQSERPPGTQSMSVVVTATAMQIQQAWSPDPTAAMSAGDVIVRSVTRNAEGTTAMMLPPIAEFSIDGAKVYGGTPSVDDRVQRGDATAHRIDTIKYQFQRGGDFTLPDLSFSWWDPDEEKLQQKTLSGASIRVSDAGVTKQNEKEPEQEANSVWIFAVTVLLFSSSLAWLLRNRIARWIAKWRARHHRPDAIAARELRAACAANDASTAYAAMLAWLQAMQRRNGWDTAESFFGGEQESGIGLQWRALSRHLFSGSEQAADWNGSQFWNAFSQARHCRDDDSRRNHSSQLPTLNPVSVEGQLRADSY